METTKDLMTVPTRGSASCHHAKRDSGSWLVEHRGLMIGGAVAVAAVALGLSQHWLTLATLAPLLFVLPCALMMFACMKGHHGQETEKAQTTTPPEAPGANV